MLFEVVIN